ncbi:hypothetical protein [Nocardia sp. alder85J]|nr:hypothetical protein [Nocardia sp. alder85J]MCX4092740.1 hypothetical protein [Nocardia sp. alder85J]
MDEAHLFAVPSVLGLWFRPIGGRAPPDAVTPPVDVVTPPVGRVAPAVG